MFNGEGKINLTPDQIRANLKQILEGEHKLTPEQRYALRASMDSITTLKRLSPGIRRALDVYKRAPAAGTG